MRRIQLLRLLAHEHFHSWNGQRIALGPPQQDGSWFSEGFTDFYSARLLQRAGLIDDAEGLAGLNRALETHWRSRFATVPAEILRSDAWKRPELDGLAMHRGMFVARLLDEEIRGRSAGQRSVDDFFLDVLHASRPGETRDTPRFLARIARWTDPECAEEIRRVVMEGAMPRLPDAITEPAAERADFDSHRFDPGFALEVSRASRIVTGVVEGGPAFAAGLRDGQEIGALSAAGGDPEAEIQLTVRDGAESRAVRFCPRGGPLRIPRYRLKH